MKTPEEIKRGLEGCGGLDGDCENCPYDEQTIYCNDRLMRDALAYIQQLESTVSQVSKALCDKENATLEELLQEVSQVKSRLAQVERERDELIRNHIPQTCDTCKYSLCFSFDNPCNTCDHIYRFNAIERGDTDRWEFVGVCPENTKEAAST